MKELRKRKPNRLKDYDYSKNGAYFITICSKDRLQIFSTISNCRGELCSPVTRADRCHTEEHIAGEHIAGEHIAGGYETNGWDAGEHSSPLQTQIINNKCSNERQLHLTEIGLIIENEIKILSNTYTNIHVTDYVIMPNHIHMIIIIEDDGGTIEDDGRTQFAPTVSRVVKQWKGVISKKIGFSPWQKSFHDHIIRNEDDYIRISEYIANNPQNWKEDCFFTEVQI